MRRSLPFIIIAAVLVVFSIGGFLLFRAKNATVAIKTAQGEPGAQPAQVRGGERAGVTLEEFGDFQCPPCGILSTTLLQVEKEYGERIRVIFREFPLTMHAHSMTAARAAEAAGLQGHFWEMHDLLFEHAMFWSKDPDATAPPTPSLVVHATPEDAARVLKIFTEYAGRVGLDIERFKKDMESESVDSRIKADQKRGFSVGIDRTPVLLIDGARIPFAKYNVESLHKIIDDALAGKPPEGEPSPTPTPQPAVER